MKREYRKPELKSVKLVPEEAVLAGCKTTMTTSGGGRRCRESSCRANEQGS